MPENHQKHSNLYTTRAGRSANSRWSHHSSAPRSLIGAPARNHWLYELDLVPRDSPTLAPGALHLDTRELPDKLVVYPVALRARTSVGDSSNRIHTNAGTVSRYTVRNAYKAIAIWFVQVKKTRIL